MLKTKKQIIEDLKLIDVIIEILDARIPLASQNPDIKQITENKKKIVVLNKSDLEDEKEKNQNTTCGASCRWCGSLYPNASQIFG